MQQKIYLFKSSFISANTFNERNGKRIQLIRLMGFVDNSQRYSEVQDLQVSNFLGQCDDFRQEVDAEAQDVSPSSNAGTLSVDREDAARDSQIALLHFPRPIFEDFLGVQLQAETVAISFKLLPFYMVLPAFAYTTSRKTLLLGILLQCLHALRYCFNVLGNLQATGLSISNYMSHTNVNLRDF